MCFIRYDMYKRVAFYRGKLDASSFCRLGGQYKAKSKAELNEVLPCFLLYISNYLLFLYLLIFY